MERENVPTKMELQSHAKLMNQQKSHFFFGKELIGVKKTLWRILPTKRKLSSRRMNGLH